MPLGATFGKAFVFGNGDFLDLSVGAYLLAMRPDKAPSWQLKLGVSYFFNQPQLGAGDCSVVRKPVLTC